MAGQNKLTPEQRKQLLHLITSRCSNVEKQHSKQTTLYVKVLQSIDIK